MKVFYTNAMLIITALDTPSDTVGPVQDCQKSVEGQHILLHGNRISGMQGLQEKICRMVSPRPETTGHGETQPFPGTADLQVVILTAFRKKLKMLWCKNKSIRWGLLHLPSPPPIPPMQPVPRPAWFLAVYVRDVVGRLEETKAQITSLFGTILKMDSTKKV